MRLRNREDAWRYFAQGGEYDEAPAAADWGDTPGWRKVAYSELRRQRQEAALPVTFARPLPPDEGAVAEYVSLVLLEAPTGPEEADAWLAWGEIARASDGHLVIGSLSLGPLTDAFGGEGVSYRVWQALKPPQILEAARRYLDELARWGAMRTAFGWSSNASAPESEALAADVSDAAPRRRGRLGYEERFYIEFAYRWLSVQNDPQRRDGVLKLLAEAYERPQSAIRTWVGRAEELELLTSGRRGARASRQAGPRLPMTISQSNEGKERHDG